MKKIINRLLCRLLGHLINQEALYYMGHKECNRCGVHEYDQAYIISESSSGFLADYNKYQYYGLTGKASRFYRLSLQKICRLWQQKVYYPFLKKERELPF